MLPQSFLNLPLAHRGLHDLAAGRPENSRAAIRAAIEHGYGIEIDVQLTADDYAVVFHDYDLERLTEGVGLVRDRSRSDLARLALKGGDEAVPDLSEVLEIVAGQVPLLVEIKDQDGALGGDVGALEAAVADCLTGYEGPVAVMSFNPNSTSAMQTLAPAVPRGLVTDAFRPEVWGGPEDRLAALAEIRDFDRVGACFISHNHRDLQMESVSQLKARSVPILCWTIRSPEEEATAREIVDNVTFEGYLPALST